MYIKKVAICMLTKSGKPELYLLEHRKYGKKPLFKK